MSLLLLVCGCSAKADIKEAGKAVDQFHQQMSAGEYDAIYDSATNSFRAAGSRNEMQEFLKRVNRKMGACTDARQKHWNINATTSGRFIQLGYIRKCANGDLQELFVWKMENGRPALQGYNVTSPLLLAD